MKKVQDQSWRCTVCGYIHTGEKPPEYCPVCGAGFSDFEKYSEDAVSSVPEASGRRHWKCAVCDYITDAVSPDVCPVCGASASSFESVSLPEDVVSAPGGEQNFAIIGAGIAGISAAESIRKVSAGARITIISREEIPPYYRLNLTRLLAGEIPIDALPMHTDEWYAEQRIEILLGAEVSELLLKDGVVLLKDGRRVTYNKLIMATGAHPFIPPIRGVDLRGVVTLRTAGDASRILDRCGNKERCVCIGGGILGLETAAALVKNGVEVTLLESHEWLMPRQLNQKAGELLGKVVLDKGIKLLTKATTDRITGDVAVAGVLLKDGRSIPAEFVIITTGVRPDTYLARKAGLEVDKGVTVNNHMQTSVENVYAAGDLAEHNGVLYGNWNVSMYQGAIAGLNAAGVQTVFGGVPRSNVIKVLGVDLLSVGQVETPDGGFMVIEEQKDDKYIRFVFHDGRMVGGILLGDASAGTGLKKAVETGTDFSLLLASGAGVSGIMKRLTGL